MNDFIDKIKIICISLIEKVKRFYEDNKKLSIIICGMLIVILICIILLISLSKNNKNKPKEIPLQTLELTEKLFVPDGPELPLDYKTSRKTNEKWTAEEAEPYFTIPSTKEIDSLATSNDNMINELLGAAP